MEFTVTFFEAILDYFHAFKTYFAGKQSLNRPWKWFETVAAPSGGKTLNCYRILERWPPVDRPVGGFYIVSGKYWEREKCHTKIPETDRQQQLLFHQQRPSKIFVDHEYLIYICHRAIFSQFYGEGKDTRKTARLILRASNVFHALHTSIRFCLMLVRCPWLTWVTLNDLFISMIGIYPSWT